MLCARNHESIKFIRKGKKASVKYQNVHAMFLPAFMSRVSLNNGLTFFGRRYRSHAIFLRRIIWTKNFTSLWLEGTAKILELKGLLACIKTAVFKHYLALFFTTNRSEF